MSQAELRFKQGNPFKGVPWITKDGCFDITKFPIDGVLRQALQGDQKFHQALHLLQTMHLHGREEAGIFLLGLLANCGDDWERRSATVESLEGFHTAGSARALFHDLKTVKSSNTTRRYLAAILKALSSMPLELVESPLESLIEDSTFSYNMRNKFETVLEEARIRNSR